MLGSSILGRRKAASCRTPWNYGEKKLHGEPEYGTRYSEAPYQKLWVASSCGQARFHTVPQCAGSSSPVIPRTGVFRLCVITRCAIE